MNNNESTDETDKQSPIGIDLGTTYSAIASIDATGRPICLPNQEGDFITPTALLVDEQGIVVGREAVRASVMEPHDYADCFKRDMGSSVFRRGLHGSEIPPEVLNGFVLRQLKLDAERTLGKIQQAVITVPAFFDESRRKATQDAGALAGLDVIDIINEPTAAALAYGYQAGLISPGQSGSSQAAKLLVYDLGGGTFDVTILEIDQNTYRAIATDGDVQLGGKDFDERIVEYLTRKFIEEHGLDPRTDPRDASQLWIDAETAKHTLSQRSKTTVVVSHQGVRSRIELTREKFEELTQDLIARTETTTSIVLQTAGLTWADIDRVLLVGGSSRIPAISEMLRRLSGKEPDRSLAPDHAVAQGAAIHAAMLTDYDCDHLNRCKLVNVNSHSLGVKGYDAKTNRFTNCIMIPKNSPLPCRQAKIFRTREPNQLNVHVTILEGESMLPSDCIELGDCVIRDLPRDLPAGSKIEVEYKYGADGRVQVRAKVLATRQSTSIEFHRTNSIELDSLEKWERRLLSKAEQGDATDVGSVLKQLDTLYQHLGENVLKVALPTQVKRAQLTAHNSMQQWREHRASMIKIDEQKKNVRSHAELVQISSKHAKAKSHFERSQAQAKFALVVLGRECIKHGIAPESMRETTDQIAKLRQSLES